MKKCQLSAQTLASCTRVPSYPIRHAHLNSTLAMRLNLLLCLFVPGINSADMVQPQCTLKLDTDFHGYDLGIGIHNVTSPDGCCSHCLQQPACRFFTWLNDGGSYANYCSLKTDGARNGSRRILGHVSGATIPVPPSPPPSPSPPTLPPPAMGVFFRVPWAGEVPQEQLDSWFALVARGRKEGPSSPYYVSELGLQQVATGQWPPINSSNPGIIYETELAKISKYFHLFDRVYVGTLLLPGKNYSNASYWTDYAEHQRRVATQFLELYPLDKYPNLGWYITEEGCLEDPTDLTALLHLSAPALHSVAPLPVLWSPGFCRKFVDLPGTPTGSILETELETMFCSPNMTVPVAVHFQDLCGQTSTFQFPFYYVSAQFNTCQLANAH